MARSGGRTFGLVVFGLAVALTASRAGTPPGFGPPPGEPPLPPTVAPQPLSVVPPPPPSMALVIPAPPSAPATPSPLPPEPNVGPTLVIPAPVGSLPALSGVSIPEKPPVPSEPEITEPVATVHRFEGKYLGGDKTRALLYVPANAGKAEIRSRSLANMIPPADAVAKDDVKRLEVPAGATAWHNGRAFVTTRRELWVIDTECRIDWKFALPGKADNGEKLLGVAGFQGDDVILASQYDPGDGPNVQRTGRILAFNTVTGRQSRFTTVEGGFDPNVQLLLDAPGELLVAISRERVTEYPLRSYSRGTTVPFPAMPVTHAATTAGQVFATTPQGVAGKGNGSVLVLPNATGTAPPAIRPDQHRAYLYAPIKSNAGHFCLTAANMWDSDVQKWSVRVPKEITAAPVVHGQSVYFVAGNVAYRVNVTDGAVCWKHTLALNPGETLTELTFADGELRAHGPGVLVRIEDRAEPKPVFHFGPMFGGQR